MSIDTDILKGLKDINHPILQTVDTYLKVLDRNIERYILKEKKLFLSKDYETMKEYSLNVTKRFYAMEDKRR